MTVWIYRYFPTPGSIIFVYTYTLDPCYNDTRDDANYRYIQATKCSTYLILLVIFYMKQYRYKQYIIYLLICKFY